MSERTRRAAKRKKYQERKFKSVKLTKRERSIVDLIGDLIPAGNNAGLHLEAVAPNPQNAFYKRWRKG